MINKEAVRTEIAPTRKNLISHGTLYAIAAVVLFFGVVLALVGATLDWPPQFATVHIGLGVSIALAGLRADVFKCLREEREATAALSEIDKLSRWLHFRDAS